MSAANPEAQVLTEPEMVIKNYYKSIAENKDVAKFVMMLSSAVSSLKGDVLEALQRYSDYAFLWEKDKQEAVMVWMLTTILKDFKKNKYKQFDPI